MADQTLLERITVNPDIFGGKPIIRGLRISVELVLSLLAQGETPESILGDYPDLEPDDIRACLATRTPSSPVTRSMPFESGRGEIPHRRVRRAASC
jgi:uncharacterized protein (DUF433 family)